MAATAAGVVAGARSVARGSASRRTLQTAPHVRSILDALLPSASSPQYNK